MSDDLRDRLLIAALQGLTSNAFLSQQLAAMDATSSRTVDSIKIIASLAVRLADETLKQSREGEKE